MNESEKPGESVFEKYAHEYDLLTNAAERLATHTREVQALIDRFHPASVLDAGCATGLTSSLFAAAGIPTVGLDRSAAMLAVAAAKFKDLDVPLEFVQGDFEDLPSMLTERFDLVVCIGNSLSGVGSVANLNKAIAQFHGALVPGGHLVIQMLNYPAMPDGTLIPIKATAEAGIVYIRFTERTGRKQRLFVLRIDTTTQPPTFEVFSNTFDSFSKSQIFGAAVQAGFKKMRRYGKLDLSTPLKKESRDIVLVLKKE